jgi:hypothetical protein
VDGHQGLARPGCHGYQHLPLAVANRLFDRLVRLALVGPNALVHRNLAEPAKLCVEVAGQQLVQSYGRVEA